MPATSIRRRANRSKDGSIRLQTLSVLVRVELRHNTLLIQQVWTHSTTQLSLYDCEYTSACAHHKKHIQNKKNEQAGWPPVTLSKQLEEAHLQKWQSMEHLRKRRINCQFLGGNDSVMRCQVNRFCGGTTRRYKKQYTKTWVTQTYRYTAEHHFFPKTVANYAIGGSSRTLERKQWMVSSPSLLFQKPKWRLFLVMNSF